VDGNELRQAPGAQPTFAYLPAPVEQQAGINLMARRHLGDPHTRLLRLSDDAKLLLDAPASPVLLASDDLDCSVWHAP
jgi:hypothetical protein